MFDRDINKAIHILKKSVKSRHKTDIDYLCEYTAHLDYFHNRFEEEELEIVKRKCCKALKYEFYKAGQEVFKISNYLQK